MYTHPNNTILNAYSRYLPQKLYNSENVEHFSNFTEKTFVHIEIDIPKLFLNAINLIMIFSTTTFTSVNGRKRICPSSSMKIFKSC